MRRHLRLFNARFDGSLTCALIVALQLPTHPENIGLYGLVVTLHPRPHKEAGARFRLHTAVVEPMANIEAMMRPNGGAETLVIHRQKREELRKESGGEADYGAVVVVATNEGSDPLPGPDHGIEIR